MRPWALLLGLLLALGGVYLLRTPVWREPECRFEGPSPYCVGPQLQNPWAIFALPLFALAGVALLLGLEPRRRRRRARGLPPPPAPR